MIRASFCREGERLRLTVSGHAEYSHGGDDIVCAAVSGIFYALTGYLANFGGGLDIISVRSGFADIECSQCGEEAMKQACIGLLQMQSTYPEHVGVDDNIWRWRINAPREVTQTNGIFPH